MMSFPSELFLLLVILVSTLGYLAWQFKFIGKRLTKIDETLEVLSSLVTTVDDRLLRTSVTHDSMLNDSVQKMQANVTSLEMQLRDAGHGRENPEMLELAIRFVHEGMDTEQIKRKTGLPSEVVESISLFHKR